MHRNPFWWLVPDLYGGSSNLEISKVVVYLRYINYLVKPIDTGDGVQLANKVR
jgi:hypothetical protein